MKIIPTLETAHEELLRSVLRGPLTEEDALLWMVLLHTHAIHLRPGTILEGCGNNGTDGPIVLPPETQRGVASVMAALWPNRSDERADYIYWYWQYNTRVPYEVLSDVPADLMPRLLKLRDLLAQDPRVAAVVEDDD
jgi:hypothetical protein